LGQSNRTWSAAGRKGRPRALGGMR
jgi:hypothetical protein